LPRGGKSNRFSQQIRFRDIFLADRPICRNIFFFLFSFPFLFFFFFLILRSEQLRSIAKVPFARLRERPALARYRFAAFRLFPPSPSRSPSRPPAVPRFFFPTIWNPRNPQKSLRSALNTFHVPAAVINTNERVFPTVPAQPARISSKETLELTARNIESRAASADEKERLKFHSFYWQLVSSDDGVLISARSCCEFRVWNL